MFPSQGANSQVYIGKDCQENKDIIIKVCADPMLNHKEHHVLSVMNQDNSKKNFPKILGGGAFSLGDGRSLSYVIEQKLGNSLKHHLF